MQTTTREALATVGGADEVAVRAFSESFALREELLGPGAAPVLGPAQRSRGTVSRLDERFLAVIRSIGLSIESSDGYTFGHCERVARYAARVATALGLDAGEVAAVRLGAYLHDVGKIRVPQEILNKPGRLTAAEFGVIKMHPTWGLELLEGVEFPFDVRPTIRWHHEKSDGSGYPDGLLGDEIPLHAAIIGIADVFDALTTCRSYRPAMSGPAALYVMHARRRWWRPEVYAAFRRATGASPMITPSWASHHAGVPAARPGTRVPA